MKESKSFVSEGTTGLCTWQASIALTNWLLQTENLGVTDSKTILELGAGTGLCGLSLVKFCTPKKVILTDGSVAVVENLKTNIALNFENTNNIENKFLPWENIDSFDLQCIDLILGADVVYDSSVFEDLTNTMLKIFECSSRKCEMILASTIRNENTYKDFKQILKTKGFRSEACSVENNMKYFFWNSDTPIEILKISME